MSLLVNLCVTFVWNIDFMWYFVMSFFVRSLGRPEHVNGDLLTLSVLHTYIYWYLYNFGNYKIKKDIFNCWFVVFFSLTIILNLITCIVSQVGPYTLQGQLAYLSCESIRLDCRRCRYKSTYKTISKLCYLLSFNWMESGMGMPSLAKYNIHLCHLGADK